MSLFIGSSSKFIKSIYLAPLNNSTFDDPRFSSKNNKQINVFKKTQPTPFDNQDDLLFNSVSSSTFSKHENNAKKAWLDISYITPNIIVGSYPVIKYPKLFYHNSLKDLITCLNTYHGLGHWKIINLKSEHLRDDYEDIDVLANLPDKYSELYCTCSNKDYIQDKRLALDRPSPLISKYISTWFLKHTLMESLKDQIIFHKLCSYHNGMIDDCLMRCGWLDHQVPEFAQLQNILDIMHEKISLDANSAIFIHCRLGKGRSGTVVVAYMMKYCQLQLSEARDLFKNKRFKTNMIQGVSIKSQLRYLRYHEYYLQFHETKRQNINNYLQHHRPFDHEFEVTQNFDEDAKDVCCFKIRELKIVNPFCGLTILSKMNKSDFILEIKFQKYNSLFNKLIDILLYEVDYNTIFSSNKTNDNTTTMQNIYDIDIYHGKYGKFNNFKNMKPPVKLQVQSKETVIIKEKNLGVGVTDIRLSIKLKSKKKNSFVNVLAPLSSPSYFWFNLYFETLFNSLKTHELDYYTLHNLKKEQSENFQGAAMGTLKVSWEELDGFKGSQMKGLRLFDYINLKWSI